METALTIGVGAVIVIMFVAPLIFRFFQTLAQPRNCFHCKTAWRVGAVYCSECGRNDKGQRAPQMDFSFKSIVTHAPPPILKAGTVMFKNGAPVGILQHDFAPHGRITETWDTI